MEDILFIAGTVGFFALCVAYIRVLRPHHRPRPGPRRARPSTPRPSSSRWRA